jgi:hypothetical protein
MSGQFHAPAALPLEKETSGRGQEGCVVDLLPLPVMEPRPPR